MHEVDPSKLKSSWFKMARKIIKPDRSRLDEKDHEIARLRQILNMFQERVAYFHLDIDPQNEMRKYVNLRDAYVGLGNILYTADKQNLNFPDGTSQPEIYEFCEREGIYDHEVCEEHSGECTGEMHQCKVCYVEQFYDLKSEIKDMTVERQRLFKAIYEYEKKRNAEMGFIRRVWKKIW